MYRLLYHDGKLSCTIYDRTVLMEFARYMGAVGKRIVAIVHIKNVNHA